MKTIFYFYDYAASLSININFNVPKLLSCKPCCELWFSIILVSSGCAYVIILYSRHDILEYIRKKHGKAIYDISRSFETLITKFVKVTLYIKFIKTCKREGLIPTFVNAFINQTT